MSLLSPNRSIPWRVRVDGPDLMVSNARVTCFGGSKDPQDNGETASGLSTKLFPWLPAMSLPMDALKLRCSKAVHQALDGSPIPLMSWGTLGVIETVAGQPVERFTLPLIDRGPDLTTGNALDLTVAAARLYKSNASATSFELINCTIRLLGAARFAL